MTNQKRKISQMTGWARRYWIGGVALLLALLLVKVTPAWASPNVSPVNQTVPDPTATPENTPVPQATNTPNDDDDDDDNPPAPTWTPTQPGGGQPAPTATSPAAGETPASPPADGSITGVVIADALNVRSGPGTGFGKLGTVVRDQVVTVLARNDAGDWWLICCVTNTEVQGWVSASYLQPNFDITQLTTLVPLAQDGSAPAPTVAPTAAPAITQTVATTTSVQAAAQPVTQTVASTETLESTVTLEVVMQQSPQFVAQGQPLEIQFAVTNTTEVDAVNVELRDELPPELNLIMVTIGGEGELVPQTGVAGRYVLDILWPALAAGESVTATLQLEVASDVPDGAVIDNLAVATADNAASSTAGITIGMPPTSLPDFQ